MNYLNLIDRATNVGLLCLLCLNLANNKIDKTNEVGCSFVTFLKILGKGISQIISSFYFNQWHHYT
jgi:hypothetical protein